jgi:tetratricopeptide (TPR) repeat protein
MGGNEDERTALRHRAEDLLGRLRGLADREAVKAGRQLVDELRRQRDFAAMEQLAEAIGRQAPADTSTRRLYAQSLIETGHATAAIDVLRALTQRLRRDDPEWAEARGLSGRAYKQIFADAGDQTSVAARTALKQAIAAYREPFEQSPATNTWHGVNLAALLSRARRIGLRVAPDLDPKTIARDLIKALAAKPVGQRDHWHHASLAEAYLALGGWDEVERHLQAYVADSRTSAFDLGSTLRQFTEVWHLEEDPARGRGLVATLRARLMQLPGGELDLSPAEVRRLHAQPGPERGQLEAILGSEGPVTWRWWQTGLERARAVCTVRERLGGRVGTGFLIRAGDLGLEPSDERLVLTNHHVVNDQGVSPGLSPDAVEIVFEAVDAARAHSVDAILWRSPVDRHDACLLRLASPIEGVDPLPIAKSLPVLPEELSHEDRPRVYIIGHPGGRELAFSFQDNELLDHEGPPRDEPPNLGVRRVHYRAPTECGSSGSPVFNARLWEVIALHHMGGRTMPRLNGRAGSYAANQGIWMQSIVAALCEP